MAVITTGVILAGTAVASLLAGLVANAKAEKKTQIVKRANEAIQEANKLFSLERGETDKAIRYIENKLSDLVLDRDKLKYDLSNSVRNSHYLRNQKEFNKTQEEVKNVNRKLSDLKDQASDIDKNYSDFVSETTKQMIQ